MLIQRSLTTTTCALCRLRATIALKQASRSRRSIPKIATRTFATYGKVQQVKNNSKQNPESIARDDITFIEETIKQKRPEVAALDARKKFGDQLPEGFLNDEEYRAYERLYGKPLRQRGQTDVIQDVSELDEELQAGTGVLREADDGGLEEVEFDDLDEDLDEGLEDDAVESGVLDRKGSMRAATADARLADDIKASLDNNAELDQDQLEENESYIRTHPATLLGRFGTSPSTLPLPQNTLIEPIEAQLAGLSNMHLSQAAHRIFGGVGLPYSTSTPSFGKTMQQKSIPLEASQSHMSEIEADTFLSTLFPGIYASIMSVLAETRKRLGSTWAESLVRKAEKGELRILDVGGGGAGVLAVREVLRAEWERLHEESNDVESGMALAEADGRVGGASLGPPLGQATVLTGSDTLRKRASKLLENTTFVPRLPDCVHAENAKREGKFDLIVAAHTLWALREDWARRAHIDNLWSLLKQEGGVLVMLEKGVARGFECIAGARQLLLDQHISPASTGRSGENGQTGTILAPCTNHSSCPMYQPQGMLKGRRDICHFSQRYVRPPFLQKILAAKDKNFEDVKFSYLSVMRGVDLIQVEPSFSAEETTDSVGHQGEAATDRAFEGYEQLDPSTLSPPQQQSLSLSLPRAVWGPLKRRGHVILDLCTPSGTLERWTVPRSFSKQAFRDARKSSWADLWALGAKTRVRRTVRGKKKRDGDDDVVDLDVKIVRRKSAGIKGKAARRKGVKEWRKAVKVD